MKTGLILQQNLYPKVTPAGAYYAISGKEMTQGRSIIFNILDTEKPRLLSEELLQEWSGSEDIQAMLTSLYRLQKLDFVYGDTEYSEAESHLNLESRLSEILKELSDTGKAVLADDSGLYLATAGFHHESAEEIAALSGEVTRLSEQHQLLIKNNLNINQNSWAICNPTGRSELAFFPMYFGEYKIILVISGQPLLQSNHFVDLVRILFRRYGK